MDNSALTQSVVKPYPVDYALADFAPGGSAALEAQAADRYHHIEGDTQLAPFISNGVLSEGLYYVKGQVQFPGHALTGRATIVATDTIHVSASGGTLEPYARCLLAFSGKRTDQWAVKLSGSDIAWRGVVIAPEGGVDVTGSGNAVMLGSLIGRTVTVSGFGFRITGIDLDACTPLVSPLTPKRVGTALELAIPTVDGLIYLIEYTDSLSASDWRPWTLLSGDGTVQTLRPPATSPQRFYRLRLTQ